MSGLGWISTYQGFRNPVTSEIQGQLSDFYILEIAGVVQLSCKAHDFCNLS